MWNANEMMGGFGWFGGSGMFLGPVLMIGFWALIIYLFVLVIRWAVGGTAGTPSTDSSALELLKERFARGEIDEREYEDRKRRLLS